MNNLLRWALSLFIVPLISVALAAGCSQAPDKAKSPKSAGEKASAKATDSDSSAKQSSGKASAEGKSTPADGGTSVAAADGEWKKKAAKTPPGKLVPLEIRLPQPAFRGTPVPLKEPNVEEPLGKPRPPLLVPEGTVNVARGRPVTGSDPMPPSGEYDLVTDGDKEASDYGYLKLRPGTQWIQIDLGQTAAIYAVLIWHNHAEARVYRDVIVQISDDPDFITCDTIYNNDYDNSSGQGIGADKGYVETAEGKLLDGKGFEGRYIRLYSRGNTMDEDNHYTEVEVYGRPT